MATKVDLMTGCILGRNDLHHAATSQRILAFPTNEFDVTVFVPTVVVSCVLNRLSKLQTEASEGA